MVAVLSSTVRDERFAYVRVHDPLARPLFDELVFEYSSRYEGLINKEDIFNELQRYPTEAFVAPHGAFVLLLRDGEEIGRAHV